MKVDVIDFIEQLAEELVGPENVDHESFDAARKYRAEVMTEIFAIFEGGGSDEPLLGIYSTADAASRELSTQGSRAFLVRYVLNEDTQEFEAVD